MIYIVQILADGRVWTVYTTAHDGQTAIEKAKTELTNTTQEFEAVLGITPAASFTMVCKGQDLPHQEYQHHSYKLA